MNVQKSYCTTPCVSIGGGSISVDNMLKFYIIVFYVMGKGLPGKLSCMKTGLVIVIIIISSFSINVP